MAIRTITETLTLRPIIGPKTLDAVKINEAMDAMFRDSSLMARLKTAHERVAATWRNGKP